MRLECLAGHTVDVDLLPAYPRVLDVGCREGEFCGEFRRHASGLFTCLEPDPVTKGRALPIALTGSPMAAALYAKFPGDGMANRLASGPVHGAEMLVVRAMRIEALMASLDIEHWDVVKLDCEGSEFGILENWPGPIATQITVEFHDGIGMLGPDRRPGSVFNDSYFHTLFSGPLKDYRVVQHELTPVGPANTLGHWDSLLVLRSAERGRSADTAGVNSESAEERRRPSAELVAA
jgi:hypothetical protein